ncbi:MAG: sulfatase [Planctomycetes bacterium]|nr:sulfatase [Planctomycetota bacterium]
MIRKQKRPGPGSVLLHAASLLWVCSMIGCDLRPIPEMKNLVFITIDTLRADALGCCGDEGGHSPCIDALAGEGVLFENCVAPMATTSPSHASMMTGIYPRFHGVRWNGDKLDEKFKTVAEILESKGWDTAAFVAAQTLIERRGLGQGFVETSPEIDDETNETGIRSGREVNDLTRKWLEERGKERPFFIWLHYFEPHGPYPLTPFAEAEMIREDYEGPFRDVSGTARI